MTAAEACVAMDEVLLDRAGDVGLRLTKDAVAGGDGAANEPDEFRCWCAGPVKGDGGAKDVGVGAGVGWFDEGAGPAAVTFLGISPVYTLPNSPGSKESVEQYPSDEDMTSVKPSLDLAKISITRLSLHRHQWELGRTRPDQ